jgi:diacylglycerol kinase family enzyme
MGASSIFRALLAVYIGSLRSHPMVEIHGQSEGVSIDFLDLKTCETDGEIFKARKIKLSILKRALIVSNNF